MKGFSLIELLICLLLSSIIILSLIMTTARHRANQEQQVLELQLENHLYYAKNQLEQNIRGAGYTGCGSLNSLSVESYKIPIQSITGTEHSFKIGFADPEALYLPKDMDSPSADLIIQNTFPADKLLIISDCQSADIFQNLVTNPNLIFHPKFQKSYKANSSITSWTEISYEVLPTNRKGKNGQWIYALYVRNSTLPSRQSLQELAENIVEMNIDYASDLNDFQNTKSLPIADQPKILRINLKAETIFKNQPIKKELTFFVTLRNEVTT
jgi:prepilin-type N-terminal cleavage/methylation domain-containing protein